MSVKYCLRVAILLLETLRSNSGWTKCEKIIVNLVLYTVG